MYVSYNTVELKGENMNHNINIKEVVCIGCGNCIKDCPSMNINLINKKAILKGQECLKCGHCVAICPVEAVSMTGYDHKPYEISKKRIDSDLLLSEIRSRRSIRAFKNENVDKDIILNIIEAGRWSPTAKNVQDVSYVVINKEMQKIELKAVEVFNRLLKFIKIFKKQYKNINIDNNFFFKEAPVAIVIVSDSKINGSLAASNMAMMAESYGLGVLYSGFFSVACNLSKSLRKGLDINGKKVVTTLVVGYPDVKYYRTAQRDDAKIIFK